MDELYTQVCNWENLRLAHHKAARGKRGTGAAAAFEYNLADHLLELQRELAARCLVPRHKPRRKPQRYQTTHRQERRP